ncbi:MAG: hypothetical protein HYT06_02190 [Candidatus Levybacteria bacterium]|nr:hypothetical protein [Candidatus Levybacteria bacterium]
MEEQEKSLPLPEKDLPLPQKEIPDTTSNGSLLKSTWVKIGIAVMILILFLGGTYLFGKNKTSNNNQNPTVSVTPIPTPNQIADWQTVTNSIYEYSFSYPSERYDSLIDPKEPKTYSVQSCPTGKAQDCAFPSNIFEVKVFSNPQQLSLDQWLKTGQDSTLYRECYIQDPRTNVANISFLGQNATEYKFIIDKQTSDGVCKGEIMEGGGKFRHIIFIKDGNIYRLAISLASKDIYPELEQILSTFKFNISPSTSPTPTKGEKVACTQEAKLCPDGNYVGRVGPNCEFAPCPK